MEKMKCSVCGFLTEEPLSIAYHDETMNFCCFECAINRLAPQCMRCKCKVIGHGAYGNDGVIFCSHHCATQAGKRSTAA